MFIFPFILSAPTRRRPSQPISSSSSSSSSSFPTCSSAGASSSSCSSPSCTPPPLPSLPSDTSFAMISERQCSSCATTTSASYLVVPTTSCPSPRTTEYDEKYSERRREGKRRKTKRVLLLLQGDSESNDDNKKKQRTSSSMLNTERASKGKMTGIVLSWSFLFILMTSWVLVVGKLANNETGPANANAPIIGGGLTSGGLHYAGTQQSENFISCHFNPLCFCKYDQKTEIYDSVRRLWQMVGFNQTNFFHAMRAFIQYLKNEPKTYFISEAELNNFAWLLVNASLSPVPQSPAYLVEPGPVFDIECNDVPIALIPTGNLSL